MGLQKHIHIIGFSYQCIRLDLKQTYSIPLDDPLLCLLSKGLVTNYGEGGAGATKWKWGGDVKFYSYEKGVQKKFKP